MKTAAIDLGSNTVKMTIAERANDGTLSILKECADFTRIGERLDQTGRLQPEAIERTLKVVAAYVQTAESFGVARMACVGTAGLRGAENADVFLQRAREEAGIDIEVIEGLREAALAYRAPAAAYGPGPMVVVDIGGRSTEIIAGNGPSIDGQVSLEMGSVRLTERYLPSDPPRPDELEALDYGIQTHLANAPSAASNAVLVGVSGTILSLMGVHLGLDDMSKVARDGEGGWLLKASVEEAFAFFAARPADQRRRGTVIPQGRADVIVAGTALVRSLMTHYGVDQLRVTRLGVRYGLLAELFDRDDRRSTIE